MECLCNGHETCGKLSEPSRRITSSTVGNKVDLPPFDARSFSALSELFTPAFKIQIKRKKFMWLMTWHAICSVPRRSVFAAKSVRGVPQNNLSGAGDDNFFLGATQMKTRALLGFTGGTLAATMLAAVIGFSAPAYGAIFNFSLPAGSSRITVETRLLRPVPLIRMAPTWFLRCGTTWPPVRLKTSRS